MGHIKAHYEISLHVINYLALINPNEDYMYLELGNFITDIDQFRDPFANMSAKKQIWQKALTRGVIPIIGPLLIELGVGNVRPWMDDLLGTAEEGKRYGALSNFFQHISRFVTNQFFADDSPTPFNTLLNLFEGASGKVANATIKQIPFGEVNRIFDWAFTQYYPHEHIDFPPYLEGIDQQRHPLYKQSKRGLIGYLEEQIQYISEELSKIEYEWVKNRNLSPSHPIRHDILVKLGHILHAVEDYFFHSNFIELWQWHKIRRFYPLRKPDTDEKDYNFLLQRGLQGTRHNVNELDKGTSILLTRRFARRIRYPIFIEGTKGNQKISMDATNLVFTGGFAQKDMFHTIGSALHGIEEILLLFKSGQNFMNSNLVLLKTFFNEEERRKMVRDEKYKEGIIKKHQEQLVSGTYRTEINKLRNQNLITEEGRKSLLQAFDIDYNIEKKYSALPGVGGFLIEFLTLMQKEVDFSARKVEEFNKNPASIYNKATENGASEEMIGTHTLMAKDGSDKQPLRNEAMILAKFASSSIADYLVRRVKDDPNPDHGLDWDNLVRHFIRFPHAIAGSWEDEVLTKAANGGRIPTLEEIHDKPNYPILSTSDSRLNDRRQGRKKQDLEARYQQLERRVD
ncbi:hypothetical protein [Bacillus sp. FDAARGOS_235]|uniref:hypothetical protein n=1 Tax=Bacillus sp. FDAARGOS_235 TaxID=1839798 RepID=UPI0011A1C794|nr:hypothetical protein [Bacillus sp. FDAARGOS_235]